MIALVGAMFVAMGSVSAATGQVSVEIDQASAAIEVGNGYEIQLDADDDPTHNVEVATAAYNAPNLTVTGRSAGTTIVTMVDADPEDTSVLATKTYEVTVLPFGFAKIESDDSDNTVKAGTRVKVTATLNSQAVSGTTVTLTVPTTGLSLVKTAIGGGTPDGTTQSQTLTTSPTVNTAGVITGKTATFTVLTAGAPVGSYTLTFVADHDGAEADATKDVTDTSFVLKIGDPGTGLASATLGPNNVNADGTAADPNGSPDKTTKPKNSTIHLVVTSLNSLGEKSNPGDVAQVIVFAVGGTIDGSTILNTRTFVEDGTNDDPTPTDDVGATQAFSVTRTTPGTITVSATVVGTAGDVKTNELDLVFTGDAEAIELGDPSDQLGQSDDEITVEVTATDDAGSPASITPLQITSVKVLDSEGNAAKNITVSEEQKQDTKGTEDTDDDTEITTAVVITVSTGTAAKADAGTYTLEAKLGTKDTATVDFVVSGGAAHVALTIDNTTPSGDDEFITATAIVTDMADGSGNPVADDTPVTFSASGMGQILVDTDADGQMVTKDGKAMATFVVVGPGRSVVSAIAGTGRDAERVESSVGAVEPEAMPEEEASLSCLSSLSGFSTWTCDVEASASEIFDWISSRGATALHLNSNRMWVRYSVVDGAMVPGSSDFMVTKSDILYISN